MSESLAVPVKELGRSSNVHTANQRRCLEAKDLAERHCGGPRASATASLRLPNGRFFAVPLHFAISAIGWLAEIGVSWQEQLHESKAGCP